MIRRPGRTKLGAASRGTLRANLLTFVPMDPLLNPLSIMYAPSGRCWAGRMLNEWGGGGRVSKLIVHFPNKFFRVFSYSPLYFLKLPAETDDGVWTLRRALGPLCVCAYYTTLRFLEVNFSTAVSLMDNLPRLPSPVQQREVSTSLWVEAGTKRNENKVSYSFSSPPLTVYQAQHIS